MERSLSEDRHLTENSRSAKLRARIVTLLAVSVIAVSLAPLGAQAAKPSNPATAPFSHPSDFAFCSTTGSGTCGSDAEADPTGRMGGWATSSVTEDPNASQPTGTASAFANSGYPLSFNIPASGAKSITFTVSATVTGSATSSNYLLQRSYARVYLRSSASVWTGNCTSCTVTHFQTIADSFEANTAPPNVEGQPTTFTFVLQSADGDTMKGRVNVNIRLVEFASVGTSVIPMPTETKGTAEARGEAVLHSVSAKFNQ